MVAETVRTLDKSSVGLAAACCQSDVASTLKHHSAHMCQSHRAELIQLIGERRVVQENRSSRRFSFRVHQGLRHVPPRQSDTAKSVSSCRHSSVSRALKRIYRTPFDQPINASRCVVFSEQKDRPFRISIRHLLSTKISI